MDGFKPKPLLNKSELRQIKQTRTKIQGKKVLTDDVKKLKSLRVRPVLSFEEAIHYYKEPIWIEYYIPKESRFAYETKFLYVKLSDLSPLEEDKASERIIENIKSNSLIDPIEWFENDKELKKSFENSYHNVMGFLQSIHIIASNYQLTNNPKDIKTACYLTETLLKYEPTLASLSYCKDFMIHNLNYWIRTLNREKIEFSLEDVTVSLLIKRRNELWDKENLPEDSDFDLMSALFYEQAFPHRGADELSPEDLGID